jgi:hypothetical protein
VFKINRQQKQAKLQWLQNSNQINGANLQNLRQFRNKKREYVEDRTNVLETNNKNKNIRDLYRGINEFRKGYQPTTNIIKDEDGNLVTDPYSTLNRWKNFFNKMLNVHGVHDVRQMLSHYVPEPSLVEMESGTEKLKRYKSQGTNQIPAEFIKAGGETLCSEIHELIGSI